MNLLSRLFRSGPDSRDALRPLWHSIVAISREPEWYAQCGVADTVPGRFDMITAVLALVLLRLESEGAGADSALLTELFVNDMDGQLRESGVGDIVVGKHIGKLMAALGGRLAAYREALAASDDSALKAALQRNVTLSATGQTVDLARRLRQLATQLDNADLRDVMAGRIDR